MLATNAIADTAKRPRVGLVLGGGGARGAAHIGVLEVLDRLHVPVDCVAGTSMGALVGGAYAAGLSPAEMRAELARVDWRDLFRDTPDYSEQNFRYKHLSQRFVPATEVGISAQGVRTPPSFVEGQNIKLFLNRLVHSNLGERDIENLPLPLSIIAADIGNGDRVVFRKGSLTNAMRASMAVPALLAPYDYQGRKLVDGGVVDNLPVGEVRERCQADVVIAVNVSSPLLKPDQVGSLVSVLTQTINILTEQNVSHSLATLKPQDIYIKPDLDGISSTDFTKYAEAAERGKKAAEALTDRLRGLSVSEKEYQAWWNGIRYVEGQPPRVDAVEVAEMKHANPQAVERYIEQRPGEPLDTDQIERDIARVYGDGFYESVDYSLVSVRNRNILRVTPIEKPWGKDYLRLGLALDANSKEATYNLRAAYHKTWLNSLGGELFLAGQVGSEPGALVDFYQPLDGRQHFFIQPDLQYFHRNLPVYENNQRLAEYHVDATRLSLLAGANVGINGQAWLGWAGRQQARSLATGTPSLPEVTNRFGAWTMGIDFDKFNRLYLPTDGWTARFEYSQPIAGDYTKLVGDMRLVRPVGNYILHGRFYFVDSPRGTLPIYDAESLGGMQNLSGFVPNQIIGDGIRLGILRVEKVIGQMPLGVRGDVRIGAALEEGRVNHRYTETRLDGWLNTIGVYLGADTPVGPAYLGYAHAPLGSSIVYLFVGTP